MQKALVQMNIQLTEVLTDVMGATGQAIIRAIVPTASCALSSMFARSWPTGPALTSPASTVWRPPPS